MLRYVIKLRDLICHYSSVVKVLIEQVRSIILEAWEAVLEDYIQDLFDSFPRRSQAVIDARGGSTKY